MRLAHARDTALMRAEVDAARSAHATVGGGRGRGVRPIVGDEGAREGGMGWCLKRGEGLALEGRGSEP
jgi:hypothetical protein